MYKDIGLSALDNKASKSITRLLLLAVCAKSPENRFDIAERKTHKSGQKRDPK
jgi:hypothetical protein